VREEDEGLVENTANPEADWLCSCCGATGTGLLRAHHWMCRQRPLEADPEQVRSLKDRIQWHCTQLHEVHDRAVGAETRANRLEEEVQRLRLFKAGALTAVYCPKSSGTSLLLTGDAPEHDIFHYRCRQCQTEFNA